MCRQVMAKLIFLFGLYAVLLANVKGECDGYADLVIAIPGSFEVPHDEIMSFEGHLHNLLRYFAIAPDRFNIGLILYGESTVSIASPQPYKTRLQINTRVTLATQRDLHFLKLGFKQRVQPAIQQIRHMLTEPSDGYDRSILRKNAAKIGIIFTYGPTPSKDVQAVIDSANKAKNESNILLYALTANGSSRDFPHLGTDYCRLFSMNTFKDGLTSAIPDLASGICSSLEPVSRITPLNCFPGLYRKVRRIGVTCQVENNMVQPDPNNCAYYYKCEYYDSQPIRVACTMGTLFDTLTGACNWKSNVACYNELNCPNNKSMLYVHPIDCHNFVNCFNDFIPHVQSCPLRQVFDQDNQMCVNSVTCITPSPRGTIPPGTRPPMLPFDAHLFNVQSLDAQAPANAV